MGFSLSWLAVKAMSPDTLCEMLELERTTERVEVAETPLTGIELPTGWYVVVANHGFPRWLGEAWFRKLSESTTVVVGEVVEHVMYCSTEQWDGGNAGWSVVHDAQQGLYHLEITGAMPEAFEGIRQRRFAQQEAEDREAANVDHIFDIPVKLAEELTGFCYYQDQDPSLGDYPFEVLKDTRKSVVARLLDRILRRS